MHTSYVDILCKVVALYGFKLLITALYVILTSFYQSQTFTFRHTTLFEMGFVYFRPR